MEIYDFVLFLFSTYGNMGLVLNVLGSAGIAASSIWGSKPVHISMGNIARTLQPKDIQIVGVWWWLMSVSWGFFILGFILQLIGRYVG